MKEINFYCIEEDANIFLYTFLSKLVEKGKKVIIYSENQEKITKLDDTLWNIKKTGFLPHLLYDEFGAEETPVLISNLKENRYNSDFLLVSTFVNDIDFLDSFQKIFYIFSPVNPHSVDEVEKIWNSYKELGFNIKLFKKSQVGKWTEHDNFNLKDNLF